MTTAPAKPVKKAVPAPAKRKLPAKAKTAEAPAAGPIDAAGINLAATTVVPIDRIHPNPRNPRGTDLGDLTDITETLPHVGLLQVPTAVDVEAWNAANPDDQVDGDGVVLIDGHRRRAAALAVGLEQLPVVIDNTKATGDDHGQLAMLLSNLARKDLDPIVEARGLATLVEITGWSQRDVASRIGRDQAYVQRALQLMKVPADVQVAISKGDLDKGIGLALAKVANDPEVLAKASEKALRGGRLDEWAIDDIKRDIEGNRVQASAAAEFRKSNPDVDVWLSDKGFTHRVAKDAYGDAVKMDPAKHAKLSCAAVFVDRQGKVHSRCKTPKVHAKPDPTKTKAEKERAAAQARRERWAGATEARRDWLREQLTRKAKLVTQPEVLPLLQRAVLTSNVYGEDSWDLATDLLVDDDDDRARQSWMASKYQGEIEDRAAAGDQLVAIAIAIAIEEHLLDEAGQRGLLGDREHAHLVWLERKGYVPADVEAELMRAAPASAQTTIEEHVAEAGPDTATEPVAPEHPFTIGQRVIDAAELVDEAPVAGTVVNIDGDRIWVEFPPVDGLKQKIDYAPTELLPAPPHARRPAVVDDAVEVAAS